MNIFFLLISYIRFLFHSGNAHSIHSPFVFNFYTKVICPEKEYYIFRKIEQLRQKLQNDKQQIHIQDCGAGSRVNGSPVRSISSITKNASKPSKIAQVLFKTVLYFKPTYIFELGTSVGITTLYLAKASESATVITMEGCPSLSALARKNFEKLHASNIRLVEGNIDETLKKNVDFFGRADMVFFDANHRYQATMNYFNLCLARAHEDSIFIFDDIHWSKEMEQAWEEISKHPEVTVSIDFFHLGMVFFRKTQPKQHFYLRL